ncbi:MAG TPA: hypothetical protein VL443_06445 [Cyclobacteriaceae bacterium]|jgi:hypothetical protein|nr:hypothetical protein [Cyclobacteriaceae bacterium]
MNIKDLVSELAHSKLYDALEDVEHEVSFVNQGGNKWQMVLSFDLDQTELTDTAKLGINEILKHL